MRRNLGLMILGGLVAVLTILLIVYADVAFSAAANGFKLFIEMVFPSLLPFFVLSDLLLGLGIVHGLGVLLEPLMRPVFNVPGSGAYAFSMGLAAGYPMDAVITARFRKEGLCTRIEGERLLAFTNTADPLFMFGAVAVGMLHLPQVGWVLAFAHYLASFTVGFVFRWYGRSQETSVPFEKPQGNLWRRSWEAMITARKTDARPLGQMLGDAVSQSMQTLLVICAFMMFFSVIFQIIVVTGTIHWIGIPFVALFHLIGFNPDLVPPLISGLFEIDIGSAQIAGVHAPLLQKLVLISAIIAWSGLSVHGQVAAVLADSDIRFGPYYKGRVLHLVTAAMYTIGFFYLFGLQQQVLPTITFLFSSLPTTVLGLAWERFRGVLPLLIIGFVLLCATLLLSLSVWVVRRITVLLVRTLR